MSKEQDVFILSDRALLKVVEQIRDDQWELSTESIPHKGDNAPSVREMINYHAYDEAFVPDTLAGKTVEEVGDKYAGDLLGADPKAKYASIVNTTIAAVEALTEDDLAKTVHLSYGDFPANEYLVHITSFRGFRAYSIAKFLGLYATLDSDLVQGMWDEFAPHVEQWRAMGVFSPAIEVPEGADLQTKLLGLTGFLQN